MLTVAMLLFPSNRVEGSSVDIHNRTILTFDGAASTELTLGEFLDLPQMTVQLTRTNSKGKTTTGIYTGVHWTELAKAIGVSNTQSVLLVASDGFEQVYPLEVLQAPDSLFALYQDGKPITQEAHNGQVWFCADGEFTANFWTKFVVKVVVK